MFSIDSLLIMGPFILLIYGLSRNYDKLDKEVLNEMVKKDKKDKDVR